jgi:hypothetical protein
VISATRLESLPTQTACVYYTAQSKEKMLASMSGATNSFMEGWINNG